MLFENVHLRVLVDEHKSGCKETIDGIMYFVFADPQHHVRWV